MVPENIVWKFFIQLVAGMHHIHERNIVHRDLKALNILLDRADNIKIGDLGVAKVLTTRLRAAHTGVGTPYYLSPEVAQRRPYNAKSDVWALGCILYECCTRRHPFNGNTQAQLFQQIIRGNYRPISSQYSAEVGALLKACLTRSVESRPSPLQILSRPAVVAKAAELRIELPRDVRASVARQAPPGKGIAGTTAATRQPEPEPEPEPEPKAASSSHWVSSAAAHPRAPPKHVPIPMQPPADKLPSSAARSAGKVAASHAEQEQPRVSAQRQRLAMQRLATGRGPAIQRGFRRRDVGAGAQPRGMLARPRSAPVRRQPLVVSDGSAAAAAPVSGQQRRQLLLRQQRQERQRLSQPPPPAQRRQQQQQQQQQAPTPRAEPPHFGGNPAYFGDDVLHGRAAPARGGAKSGGGGGSPRPDARIKRQRPHSAPMRRPSDGGDSSAVAGSRDGLQGRPSISHVQRLINPVRDGGGWVDEPSRQSRLPAQQHQARGAGARPASAGSGRNRNGALLCKYRPAQSITTPFHSFIVDENICICVQA
jgi:hypothetical protein